MTVVALISKKFAVTQVTDGGLSGKLATYQGLFGLDEIGAAWAFTGRTAFTCAGMMMVVLDIVPTIAVIAEVRSAEESFEGIASVVMLVFLDESDDLTRRHGGARGAAGSKIFAQHFKEIWNLKSNF